jgi:hypothetical protein
MGLDGSQNVRTDSHFYMCTGAPEHNKYVLSDHTINVISFIENLSILIENPRFLHERPDRLIYLQISKITQNVKNKYGYHLEFLRL